ncbi:amidohydrolase [Erwinia psidii]|uniref:Omega-amidase YafV n=1 Tax=Erwinia psidii TaxID=69224 RepID=A0A3N6UL53_9GAMM|nr:amidohydrolase [Erwinia psidii]MCX8959243.1 amidohydrolase [Erwinia psidii]MCX8962873.1 amidohydrolase [Erwinia psidii]MCX8966020.1 amidohydrolase [Erwinia psidii]RQM36669.1 amidohydrolase [Erwinia psidii]
MSTLKLSLLQQPLVWMDGEANLRFFNTVIDRLQGRDLIVLPEMFTSGFAMMAAGASLPESRVIAWLHDKACVTDALVGGSVAIQTGQGAVNRFLLVEPGGSVHRYDKRHLFRMADEHHHYQAGDSRVVVAWRGWRILPQICYDLRFPVFSRNQNDYDLALYVANWPAPRAAHWQALLLARAIENQSYIAGCNRVGKDDNHHLYSGDSRIISPQGEILAMAKPHQPAVLNAELSLDALHQYRERFPAWRDADSFTL